MVFSNKNITKRLRAHAEGRDYSKTWSSGRLLSFIFCLSSCVARFLGSIEIQFSPSRSFLLATVAQALPREIRNLWKFVKNLIDFLQHTAAVANVLRLKLFLSPKNFFQPPGCVAKCWMLIRKDCLNKFPKFALQPPTPQFG